jgi:hypothetical protein
MRVIPLLLLIGACREAPKPTPDSGESAAAPSAVAPAATPNGATGATTLTLDAAFPVRYPVVEQTSCIGESCDTAFPAVACRSVQLRTAPADTASLGPVIALNDTVDVTQTDLHLEAPGVVQFLAAYVHNRDSNGDGAPTPAKDTVRFSAGDTLYLVRYIGQGWWDAVLRNKQYRISDGYWYSSDLPGQLGTFSLDSSVAIARSYPRVATWWHVSIRDGRQGFWKFDQERWREGLKPHRKYWEFDCNGNGGDQIDSGTRSPR